MTEQVRVSVIVAAHNAADFLQRSLSSVLRQDLRAIEVIVVDDASTDGTRDVVAELALSDERVRFVATARNVGPSAARNLGLEAATGEWVAVLDADDWFSPGRLSALVAAAEASDGDIVSDGIDVFDEDAGRSLGPMFGEGDVPRVMSALAFVDGNLPNPARPRAGFGFLKPLIRRRFMIEAGIAYAPEMRFAEDYRLYLELLMAGARWVTVPDRLYNYSVRTSSLTARHRAEDLDVLRRFEHALLTSVGPTLGRELRAALQAHCRTLDERYYAALFGESVARRHLRGAVAAMTLNTVAFRCCAKRALRGVTRRVLPDREHARAA